MPVNCSVRCVTGVMVATGSAGRVILGYGLFSVSQISKVRDSTAPARISMTSLHALFFGVIIFSAGAVTRRERAGHFFAPGLHSFYVKTSSPSSRIVMVVCGNSHFSASTLERRDDLISRLQAVLIHS